MYYAIIIIVALAAVFIILIRRMPEAMDGTQTTPERKPARTLPSLPQINLSKLGLGTKTETNPTPVRTKAEKKPFEWPKFTLPKFPKISKPAVAPEKQSVVNPVNTPKPSVTDFWSDIKTKPHSETEAPTKPTLPTAGPIRKSKNLFQDAEDLFAIKDYRKAEKSYLRLATEDPQNPKIYSRLGLIYLEQQNYEDARDAFQQAIKLEPNIASRHYNLALVYTNLGSRSKAIQTMELALKYDPSNRKYRKMLDDIKGR